MSSDVKTIFDPAEMESVGEKLGYGKDSKERLPWEHYLSQYQEADPKEIAERLGISYNEEEKSFTRYGILPAGNHGLCQNSDDSLSAEWCRIYRHRQIQNLSRNAVGRSLSETV